MSKMGRRLLVKISALALLSVSMQMIQVPRAEAFDWKIDHWNVTADKTTIEEVVEVTAFMSVYNGSFAISLNEVCLQSAQAIKNVLGGLGFAADISKRNYVGVVSGSGVCDGQSYGNMIIQRGTNQQPNCGNPCVEGNIPWNGDGVSRKVMCNKTDTYLGPFVGCSTHLKPNDASTARLQAEFVRSKLTEWYAGVRKVIGGDYNLRPPTSADPSRRMTWDWWSNYYEAYGAPSGEGHPTLFTGYQIDYIFAGKSTFISRVSGSVLYSNVPSDHRWVWAVFRS